MSRGPLEVLRELLDFEERHAEYERRANHEGREAIAQVEALVETGRALAIAQVKFDNGEIPSDECSVAWERHTAALAPFTPGQDSEGGGSSYEGLCPDCREIECSDECLTTQHPEGGGQ